MKKTLILTGFLLISLFIFSACSKQEIVINNDDNNNQTNNNYNSMNIFPENYEDLYAQGYNHALIKTNYGDILVKLYGDKSPDTVNNFLNLAKLNYYEGIKFHRVIKDFMIQVGCPHTRTDQVNIYGTGGPGYGFPDEINDMPLVLGSLAMANTGSPNSNGSQFFIVTAQSTPWLDGAHTNFGQVVEGMEVVKEIEALETNERDLPLTQVIIEKIEIKSIK
jgi:cyclophilin family peptidyl-prolyl cis-trans isomerase